MVTLQIAVVIAVIALVACCTVCALKGKWVFVVLGLFCGIFWLVGAMRLAKPGSVWAGQRYNGAKLAEANMRFARWPIPHVGKPTVKWRWRGTTYSVGDDKARRNDA